MTWNGTSLRWMNRCRHMHLENQKHENALKVFFSEKKTSPSFSLVQMHMISVQSLQSIVQSLIRICTCICRFDNCLCFLYNCTLASTSVTNALPVCASASISCTNASRKQYKCEVRL